MPMQPASEVLLKGPVKCCHRLRAALQDYPADLPLVNWGSVLSKLTKDQCKSMLTWAASTTCEFLQPHLDAVREAMRDAMPDATAVANGGCAGLPHCPVS